MCPAPPRPFDCRPAMCATPCPLNPPPPASPQLPPSYVYHALYAYFSRDNVALPGFASYFKAASAEEREHAELLMDYQVGS